MENYGKNILHVLSLKMMIGLGGVVYNLFGIFLNNDDCFFWVGGL